MESAKKSFLDLIREQRYPEAAIVGIDGLEQEITEDLNSGKRKNWIDSFNNKFGLIWFACQSAAMGAGAFDKIKQKADEIRERLESGGSDATKAERDELIELVKEIKQ